MNRAWTSVGLTAAALAALSLTVAEADSPHKPKRSLPARTIHAAPDVTSTIAKPDAARLNASKPTEPAPLVEDVSIPPPFTLPTASRARVRGCGAEWRDMKMAGTTGDDDWRDFAMHCFVDPSPQATAP